MCDARPSDPFATRDDAPLWQEIERNRFPNNRCHIYGLDLSLQRAHPDAGRIVRNRGTGGCLACCVFGRHCRRLIWFCSRSHPLFLLSLAGHPIARLF